MLLLSWIFRASWNDNAAFFPTDVGRVGETPFVPLTRTILEEDTGAYYMFADRYWVRERLQFLAIPGPALVVLLLAGCVRLRRERTAPLWFLGIAGSAAVYALWNYDYGMLRDWNLILPNVAVVLLCRVHNGTTRCAP